MRFVTSLLAIMAGVSVAAWLFSGIWFEGVDGPFADELRDKIVPLAVVALIMWAVTLVVKPIVTLLSFPFILLTLGLFMFVVNALMLKLVAAISGGLGIDFHVEGLWAALGGALVITLVQSGVQAALSDD